MQETTLPIFCYYNGFSIVRKRTFGGVGGIKTEDDVGKDLLEVGWFAEVDSGGVYEGNVSGGKLLSECREKKGDLLKK